MNQGSGKKVAAFVYNNCSNDARVLKEAKTLVDAGYDVTIHALLDNKTLAHEERDGIKITRLDKDPLHYRVFKLFRWIKGLLILYALNGYKLINWLHNKLAGFKGPESESTLMKYKAAVQNEFGKGRAREAAGFALRNVPIFLLIALILLSPLVLFFSVIGLVFLVFHKLSYGILKKLLMIFHRPLCLFDFYQKCLEEIEGKGFEYYHGHDLYTLPIATSAKKRFGGKAIYDSHELFTEIGSFTKTEKWAYTKLERNLFPQADVSITVNKTIAEELAKRYGVCEPTVIMNCPPKLITEATSSENLLLKKVGIEGDNRKVVLYQGGFSKGRGLDNLILANHHLENTVMIYMGWGAFEPELKKLAEREGLTGLKVHFTGPVDQSVLLNYTRCADVGVIPYQFVSLNNYYCSPNKLFEYMNAHIAIVASDFPELKRVIKGYQVGDVFDPESPEDIARSIMNVVSDEAKLTRIKQNTFKGAEVFNWENESKKLVDLYAGL